MLRPLRNARMKRRALGLGQVLDHDRPLARRALERLDDEPLRVLPGIGEGRRLAEPPRGDRGQPQLFAKKLARELGQVAEQRAGLEHAGAEGVGEQHVAAPRAFGEAGDAERRIGAQLERIAVVVVLPANDGVDTLQPVDRLQPDAIVAHREVAALDEREAEIARQQRVLEVGFVVRAGREQHDARRPVAARCPAQQGRAQRLEESRQMLHRQLAKHLRKDARDDQPVLERIARTGGCLRAIADDPPAPVGRACQVGRVLQQVHAAGGLQALHRAEETAMAEHHRRRNRAAAQQGLRAVDVGEDAV